jgi:hypothetical protein
MNALAIVTGSLFRAPEQRTSKAGKPFVTATIRAEDGEVSQWWRVMRLGEGDACSVQGSFKAELYPPEQPKVSLSIIADHVLALRQSPRERKAKASGDAAHRGAAAFDDSIPFGAA